MFTLFDRKPLATEGYFSEIRGVSSRLGERFVELTLTVNGSARGGVRFGDNDASIILAALHAAERSREGLHGSLQDGRFRLDVSTSRRNPLSDVLIVIRRIGADGARSGAPIVFGPDQWPALTTSIKWLWGVS